MVSFVDSSARSPRGLVKINGLVLEHGWIDFEVENNSFFSADTFAVKLSAKALDAWAKITPQKSGAATVVMDTAWFLKQQDIYAELFIGFPKDPENYGAADLKSWIYGQADDLEYDPATQTLTMSGRDLTRLFIDTKTTEKWPNMTASQIAAKLAASHGLDTKHIQATTTKSGKFYSIDHVNLTDERSEWDLLNYLATNEGFVVFVRGTSLYFMPQPDPKTTKPYDLVWVPPSADQGSPSFNGMNLLLKRALTVSRGIQVIIRSWNKKHAKGFVVTYPSKAKTIQAGKSSVGSGAQIYSKTVPNLDQQQAVQMAQNWYKQLVAHEMKLDLTMPGDNTLDTVSIIKLSGTKTAFDQTYFPDVITRSMTWDGGYSMNVSAKNHSPDSQISVL